MRLVIVSDTAISSVDGRLEILESALREIESLSDNFESIVWIGFARNNKLYNTRVPKSKNIKLIHMPSVGGKSILSKFKIIFFIPFYFKIIYLNIKNADAIHFRSPSVPAMLGMIINYYFRIQNGWIKYAGTWTEAAPLSYRFQRWWLKRYNLLNVTILDKNSERDHLRYLINPAIFEKDIKDIKQKNDQDRNNKVNIIFVGTLDRNKRPDILIDTIKKLYNHSMFGELYIIGSGPLIDKIKLESLDYKKIHIIGQTGRHTIDEYYKKSQILVLPSKSEGFPKVIAEGSLFGCVPVVSNLDGIRCILDHKSTGWLIDDDRFKENLYNGLKELLDNPSLLNKISANISLLSYEFTYEKFRSRIIDISKCKPDLVSENTD